MSVRRQVACGAAAIALVSTSNIFAQTAFAQTAPGGEPAATLQTIIVTARKREEALSDVPVAVTALTGEALVRQQALQVRDVAQTAPGLNITTDSPARAFISMRGVGVTIINTVQPGVGIFIDGIYQPNTATLNSPLVDIERVEVLRGPQGTVFGNNTLGGAINVITRPPSNEWQGRVSGTYAGPDNFTSAAASVSGPLREDLLQMRLGAAYHSHDGFMTNEVAGGDANSVTQESVNGALRFTPTEAATFTVNANFDKVSGGNTPYVLATGPTDYSMNPRSNTLRRVDLEYTGVNTKAEFDVNSISSKLTVVGAFNELQTETWGDGDYGPIDFLYGRGITDQDTYTGEIRLESDWTDTLHSLVGVFANKTETRNATTNTVVATGVSRRATSVTRIENRAVFATLFWEFADDWDLAAGARFDHQELDASVATTAGIYEADEIDPRVTLTRRWTPDLMTYVSAARGSRGGGQNPPGAPNLIYQGDHVWTYELGTKFSALQGTLSINADVFYNDYRHFIGPNAIAPSTLGVGFVTVNLNAGRVRSYGFEGELDWQLTDKLNLYGSLTLLSARIIDDAEFVSVAGYALPGDRIPFVPDWNYAAGGNYAVPLNNGDKLIFNTNLVGKGERTGGSLDPNVEPVLESYHVLNASLTYQRGNIETAIFATNLLDEDYLENYFDRSYLARAGFTGDLVHSLSIPGDDRRVGVRASVKF